MKRTAEVIALEVKLFSVVRFTDFVTSVAIPTINRWAILSRPLTRTGRSAQIDHSLSEQPKRIT